jgi:hypothetical protein
MDIDAAGEETRDKGHAVVLESDGETYLVAPGPSPSEGFVLSVLLSTPSTDKKMMDVVEEPASDKNTAATASAPKMTPPTSSTGENTTTTSDAPKDGQKTPVSDLPPPQPISSSPPSNKTVPQSSHTKVVRSNLQLHTHTQSKQIPSAHYTKLHFKNDIRVITLELNLGKGTMDRPTLLVYAPFLQLIVLVMRAGPIWRYEWM